MNDRAVRIRMFSRIAATGLFLTASVFAQMSSFPKPSYFRETFQTPNTKVDLKGPVRLADFVVDGKLELSLKAYMDLVLANNTDIQVQRFSLEMPRNAITRAFGAFDPFFRGSFNSTRARTPSNQALEGAAIVQSLSQPVNFAYQQLLPTGATYTASFSGGKTSTNSAFQNYNPSLTSNLGVNFSQPLIRNRGTYVNRLTIMTARSRLRQSEYNTKAQLLTIVGAAESAYWNLVNARENLKVQRAALDLADKSLKRSQRELELGALSPLDIFNPEQTYANAKIGVSQAEFQFQQAEDALRKQISADLDPEIRKLPINLTEPVTPSTEAPIDAEKSVAKAMEARPDLLAAMQQLDVDDLGIKAAKNSLLPDLSLTGNYQTQGRGGNYYQKSDIFNGDGTSSTIVSMVPGGFGDALNQMFGLGYPVYSFGLTLSLPIRNRRASADMADALVTKKIDAFKARSTAQQVRLDVLQAVSQVESSKAAVQLAITAREFAQKYSDAEQKKYDLGTSTIFYVLQAQGVLISAESQVVQNAVRYRTSMMNLLRLTGELLDARGIVIQ